MPLYESQDDRELEFEISRFLEAKLKARAFPSGDLAEFDLGLFRIDPERLEVRLFAVAEIKSRTEFARYDTYKVARYKFLGLLSFLARGLRAYIVVHEKVSGDVWVAQVRKGIEIGVDKHWGRDDRPDDPTSKGETSVIDKKAFRLMGNLNEFKRLNVSADKRGVGTDQHHNNHTNRQDRSRT